MPTNGKTYGLPVAGISPLVPTAASGPLCVASLTASIAMVSPDSMSSSDPAGTEGCGVVVIPRRHRLPALTWTSGHVVLAVLGEASDVALAVMVVPKRDRLLDHILAGHRSSSWRSAMRPQGGLPRRHVLPATWRLQVADQSRAGQIWPPAEVYRRPTAAAVTAEATRRVALTARGRCHARVAADGLGVGGGSPHTAAARGCGC